MAEFSRRIAALGLLGAVAAAPARAAQTPSAQTAFDFGFEALEGGPLPLSEFRGRVLLVVNTASFCGFTPQYAALQRLHDRYSAQGLVVLGVPSQDFNQESGDPRQVREFCDTMFGITFPMANLTPVRGPRAHPFFAWAARRAGPVRWNFHKYLIGRDGVQITGFPSHVPPEAPAVTRLLHAKLAAGA